MAGTLLDIASDQSTHDLRRRGVLFRAQSLEYLLLPRIDEDSQSCRSIFGGQVSSWSKA